MADVIRMPRMSDTMTEGVIVAWQKKVGDKVKPGDILAEVETDKATMELESYQEGTLLYIGVEKGASVKVDGILAIIGKAGEDYKALLDAEPKDGGAAAKTEAQPEAQRAAAETPKAEQTQPAAKPEAQPATKQEAQPQQKAETPKPAEKKEPAPVAQVAHSASQNGDGRLKASPLAKKIAQDQGIDLAAVQGSGPEGRIVRSDVEAAMSAPKKSGAPIMIPVVSGQESFEEVAVSQMRKTIARRLLESKNGAPHFYLTQEIDMDQAVESRKALNEVASVKISFNDIIIKACALALRQNPKVNSSWLGDKIRYNHHIHIGMAVAIEDGLVVPVIRFADQKTLTQISMESKDFAARAKDRKLQLPEMEGNTFSVSNLGMFDIEGFTAIINPPDACILAVGGIKQKPVVKNGELKVGNVMKVTLSCDHRVVDGATGSQFLQSLKMFLENPVRLLL